MTNEPEPIISNTIPPEVVAVLLSRLGGTVDITREDLDANPLGRIVGYPIENGTKFRLTFETTDDTP